MGKLGVFVDRQTLGNSEQLTSLIRCRDAAEERGHTVYFIFPVEIKKIPTVDALFIRSRTDPMNISFVAAKMAELHGIPVIDDPRSIQICSDKVNMYLHLMKNHVAIPQTVFLARTELSLSCIDALFSAYGAPLVLKEPSTSFSLRVEKAHTSAEFMRIAKRFMKLSDWIVVQQYVESTYDWRVGVLDGTFLYACKYIIPSETFKIQATVNGHVVYCAVQSVREEEVPPEVVRLAIAAANAIGQGFYGVDIKESPSGSCVIEVNDNPSLEGGEDACYPHIFEKIVTHLLER